MVIGKYVANDLPIFPPPKFSHVWYQWYAYVMYIATLWNKQMSSLVHWLLCLCSKYTIDSASNAPVAMAVQLGDNPTYGWPRGLGDDKRTGVETQKKESTINEWVWTMYMYP